MEIITKREGQKVTMELCGWLDTQAAPELEKELQILTPEDSLEMDLAKLEYIASAGIRQFVAAFKKVQGKMVFCNVSDNVKGIFKATGLDRRIRII